MSRAQQIGLIIDMLARMSDKGLQEVCYFVRRVWVQDSANTPGKEKAGE